MHDLYSEILQPASEASPNATALVSHSEDGASLTFRELRAEADLMSSALHGIGVREGTRVAVIGPNSIGFVSTVFGAARLGAAVIPIAPVLRPPEIAKVMQACEPQLVLVSHLLPKEVVQAVHSVCGEVPTGMFSRGEVDLFSGGRAAAPDGLTPKGTAAIVFTAGTTGTPKGVVLTSHNLLSNTRSAARVFDAVQVPPEGKVFSAVLPFFHSFGLTTCVLLPIALGAAAVLFSAFNPRMLFAALNRCRVGFLLLVPEMYRALNLLAGAMGLEAGSSGRPIPSLRVCVSGGSALPPTVAQEFERRFGVPIHQGYGVTETSPVLSVSDLCMPPIPTCSGQPIPDVELVVLDHNLQEVPAGTDGELAAAGPNVAWGYFRMPELTAQKFRELSLSGRPSKRYYLTGDLACLDEAGRVYIKGRTDDLIVVNGMNVYPAEIANALASFPGCAEVAVGRVASEKHGQEPVALMVLAEGVQATEDEVKSFAARVLAPHKIPAKVLFVDQVLKNSMQKPMVREMLLSLGLPAF